MDTPEPAPGMSARDIADRARAEVQEPLDRQLSPLGLRAMAALAARPGERILDIGCGAGQTLLQLARSVEPDGSVVGIDISASPLDVAARRTGAHGRISLIEADAQQYPFAPASFDAAFSRFGVMFFSNPAAAFRNIRRALKPEGRLAFVCWRALEENPLDSLPLYAAAALLPPQPPTAADAPGAFAFARPDNVRDILESAGFTDIEITSHDEKVGSGDLETMLAVSVRVGALGKILRESPELREAAIPPVRAALAMHDGPEGVKLTAATWVVTAKARP